MVFPYKIPILVKTWLAEQGFGEVTSTEPVGGGCINRGVRLKVQSGESFFLKTNSQAPPDMFQREAEGLFALTKPGGPRISQPFIFGSDFLLLEDLRPAAPAKDYWPIFGRQLARMHDYTFPRFGFEHDNYIGSTPQPNPTTEDGFVFFAENRLLFQARLAQRNGLLTTEDVLCLERIARRLPELVPAQPASILHGDLWSGNIITDMEGHPALIDPAAHYGWAEADLAMTTLFGAPPVEFFQAYQEVRPLAAGLEKRFPVYNLYHLLNHLNLFGKGYYPQIKSIMSRYR